MLTAGTRVGSSTRNKVKSWLAGQREWVPLERALLIAILAVALGALFLTTYSLALGDPMPRRINAGLIGSPAASVRAVRAVQKIANRRLAFHRYASGSAALDALDRQQVYTALDLTSRHPTLYVASAAGASVARVLERVSAVDPAVAVIDARPLAHTDPIGIDLFYLMLVTTIIGFVTVFQVQAQAGRLELRHRVAFLMVLALAASLALTLIEGALMHRLALHDAEDWGILALHLVAVSSFTWLMITLISRWAIVPTWLFFVILGNASSGGAISPPLLPQPFAFLSNWLPSGSTVNALRNAVYFRHYQHAHPLVVLAAWAVGLLGTWALVAYHQENRVRSLCTAYNR